jgi:hypothetical protein
MVGTLTHRPNGHLKPLLFWRHEGIEIMVYWDAKMTQRQTVYMIGESGRIGDQKYYEVAGYP